MSNLPYVFDLHYDLKTTEQLHDHLTGKQRYPIGGTDAELIEMCIEQKIPLPAEVLNVRESLAPMLRNIGALGTMIDLAVAQQALEKAQETFWAEKIQPLFGDCKSRAEAKKVHAKVNEMLKDSDGQALPMPDLIELKIRTEMSRFQPKDELDSGPSM